MKDQRSAGSDGLQALPQLHCHGDPRPTSTPGEGGGLDPPGAVPGFDPPAEGVLDEPEHGALEEHRLAHDGRRVTRGRRAWGVASWSHRTYLPTQSPSTFPGGRRRSRASARAIPAA
jgi:hypothetical protein